MSFSFTRTARRADNPFNSSHRGSPVERLEPRRLLSGVPQAVASPGFTVGAMQADPVRNLVYVLDQTNNRIDAIDTDLARMVSFADVSGTPSGLAISPDDSLMYVSSSAANSIDVYTLPDLKPQRTINVASPGMIAAGTGDRLYVVGTGQWPALRQMDAQTGKLLATFGNSDAPFFNTNAAGTRLYVSVLGYSTTGTNAYDISNPAVAPKLLQTYNTNMVNGRGLAVDEQYNRLYSSSGGEYGVYTLDMGTNTGTLWPGGGYGDAVGANASVPYVYGGTEGGLRASIFQYDRATGALLNSFSTFTPSITPGQMALTSNGALLYGGGIIGIIGKPSLTINDVPLARFSATASAFPSLQVAFDGSGSRDYLPSGKITSWAWDFGDGTTATGPTVSHTFAQAGKYAVKLTVINSAGVSDDFQRVVNLSNPPVALPQSIGVNEDSSNPITLHGSDADGDPLSFSIATAPAHGTLSGTSADGAQVTYIPSPNYFGPDSFSFIAYDGGRSSAPATVSITVANVYDPPVAKDDLVVVAGGPMVIHPLANDLNPDKGVLNITSFTQPASGTVTLVAGTSFQFTPGATPSQSLDSFDYTITDSAGTASSAVVYLSPGAAQLDGEWNTYGASAAHAGYFAGTIGSAVAVPDWSAPAATGAGFVTEGAGRLYVASGGWQSISLSALDAATGAVLWTDSLEGAFSVNAPTYFKGTLYLQRCNNSSDTQLWAIDAATGRTLWSAPFGAQWEHYYSPAVSDQGIWIDGGTYGGMYGFRADGSQIAFVQLSQFDEWAPSILGNNVYSYVAGDFASYSMTGALQWTNTVAASSWQWNGWSVGRLAALSDGRGFFTGNPNLYGINLSDGSLAWKVTGAFTGTPAVAGGVVYALSGSSVQAYDASTGAPGQVFTADQPLLEAPIVTDDAVITASSSKTYIFSIASGKLLQALPFGGKLALAGNRLFITPGDGSIKTYLFARRPTVSVDAASYTVSEGGSVTLSAVASDLPPNDADQPQWDLNFDGTTFNVDATGSNVTFSAVGLDGPSSRQVAVRVFDATGNSSTVALVTVTITNTPPTAALTGSTVPLGSAGSVAFSGQSDPSPADVAAGFTYSYDFNNDGTFDVVDTIATSAIVPAAYLAAVGPHTITGRIKDKDGGFADYTTTIQVTAPVTGLIAGALFNDINGNGTRDASETALAGRMVFIDANNNGALDAGEKTTVSDSSGNYAFTGLTAGTYFVRQVLPPGWTQSLPARAAAWSVTLTAGQGVTGKSFGSYQPSSIVGLVYFDANGNGIKDSGEGALGGVMLYIDANNNGALDAGEKTAKSDAAGNYTFAGMAPGTYRVREIVPAGYRVSYPSSGYYSVSALGGQKVVGKNFGNTKLVVLSGTIFNDLNGNSLKESGESGLGGIRVYLDANKNGVFDTGEKSTITDGAGNWSFVLPAGTYRVREVLAGGWRISSPGAGYFDISAASGQNITGKAFANTTKALISGTVFNDPNGNGIKDAGEGGLSGWTLFVDLNKDGKFDAGDVSTTSDVSGNWSIKSLSAGSYTIRVVTKSGWLQTRPTSNAGQSVTLSSGQTKTGLLVGEKKIA